jgi:hypothetical protein
MPQRMLQAANPFSCREIAYGYLGISRYAFRIGAAAALLAGCGGSWMLPEALSEDVLYISNVYTVRGTVDLGGAQTVYQWWIE